MINRGLLDWKYSQSPQAVALWVRILLKANWADGYFMGNKIERGQFATSIQSLAAECGMHQNTVRQWLKKFEKDQQITLKGTNRFTLITVINYAKYQNCITDNVKQNGKQNVDQDGEQDVKQDVKQDVDNRTRITRITRRNNREFAKPTLEELRAYIAEQGFTVDAERFLDYYEANGWSINGKAKMKDWKATVRNWQRNEKPKKTMPIYTIDSEPPTEDQVAEFQEMVERMRKGNHGTY